MFSAYPDYFVRNVDALFSVRAKFLKNTANFYRAPKLPAELHLVYSVLTINSLIMAYIFYKIKSV